MMLVLVFVLDTVNQETFVIGIFSSLPTMTKIKNMKKIFSQSNNQSGKFISHRHV